jgi:acyl dehydratase
VAEPLRYAEDYKPGDVFELGTYDVTAAEIVEFAKKYDPQPFHIDEEAAKKTIHGGLISSGWLTGIIMLQLMRRGFICVETSMGSPGHDELRWLKPVRPGDRLHGRVVVGDVRISKSRPEMGFVNNTATLTNQNGEVVFSMKSAAIFKTRAAASP